MLRSLLSASKCHRLVISSLLPRQSQVTKSSLSLLPLKTLKMVQKSPLHLTSCNSSTGQGDTRDTHVLVSKSLVTVSPGLIEELKRLKLFELQQTIESLYDASHKVSQFVDEYDFKSQQMNGYRSYLKIIQSYFYEIEAFLLTQAGVTSSSSSSVSTDQNVNNNSLIDTTDHMHLLARPLNRYKEVPSKRRDKILSDLMAIGCFFMKQFLLLELVRCKELAMKSPPQPDELEDLGDGIFIHPYERQIFNVTLAIREEDIIPFFNPEIRNFWLHGASRKMMDLFLTMGLTRVIPYSQTFLMLFDDTIKSSAGAHLALNCEVLQQKVMWSIMEDSVYRMLQKIKTLGKPIFSENITFNRQSKFGLLQDGSLHSGGPYPGLDGAVDPVDALLIYPGDKGQTVNDSLIFHCHGGGFVSMSPKGHESYLRLWSENLNIPVFCSNYGKAPERAYPHGIQDLLDAYLFVTSGSFACKSLLGFHPKNIVITGDSAGGNLALSLTLILHELSKMHPDASIIMPRAIYLLYPTANSACDISASRSMCTFDPILNIAAVFSVAQAYTGLYEKSTTPWYRKDIKYMEKILKKNIAKKKDPFANPLCYTKYDELKDIACFIHSCEFDPLLDDSISIANLWQGPVTLDLVQDHCHGFMMLAGQKAIQAHLDTFFKRMTEAFKI